MRAMGQTGQAKEPMALWPPLHGILRHPRTAADGRLQQRQRVCAGARVARDGAVLTRGLVSQATQAAAAARVIGEGVRGRLRRHQREHITRRVVVRRRCAAAPGGAALSRGALLLWLPGAGGEAVQRLTGRVPRNLDCEASEVGRGAKRCRRRRRRRATTAVASVVAPARREALEHVDPGFSGGEAIEPRCAGLPLSAAAARTTAPRGDTAAAAASEGALYRDDGLADGPVRRLLRRRGRLPRRTKADAGGVLGVHGRVAARLPPSAAVATAGERAEQARHLYRHATTTTTRRARPHAAPEPRLAAQTLLVALAQLRKLVRLEKRVEAERVEPIAQTQPPPLELVGRRVDHRLCERRELAAHAPRPRTATTAPSSSAASAAAAEMARAAAFGERAEPLAPCTRKRVVALRVVVVVEEVRHLHEAPPRVGLQPRRRRRHVLEHVPHRSGVLLAAPVSPVSPVSPVG